MVARHVASIVSNLTNEYRISFSTRCRVEHIHFRLLCRRTEWPFLPLHVPCTYLAFALCPGRTPIQHCDSTRQSLSMNGSLNVLPMISARRDSQCFVNI